MKKSSVMNEEEICQFLGIESRALATLRNEDSLPYYQVNRNSRLYFLPDIMEWLTSLPVNNCSSSV